MKRKRIKLHKTELILLLVLIASMLIPVPSFAAQDKNNSSSLKKVRVGYLIYPGYQEGEGNAPKSGYGYEYLQQIGYYAGWQYEYINGSFSELLEMLQKGKIDIMGDLSYTEERAKYMNFAKEEQGREYYYLFVREDRTDITATDFSTLNNAKIGINKGSIQVDLFKKWCKKNKIHCQIELYSDSTKRYEDMNSGKLDAIVSTTVAEKELSKYHWNAIIKIGYSPYYFAVSKKSPGLYEELNSAISKVLQSDWYYNEKVYFKYNGKTSASSAGLDAVEKEWLSQKKELKIGYMNNALPYSTKNKKDGKMIGLLSKFIEHMKERYNTTLKPVNFNSYESLAKALNDGKIDVAFPIYGSYWIAEENQFMIAGELSSNYLIMIYDGSYQQDKSSTIAVLKNSSIQSFCVKEHFPDSKLIYCKNIQECLDAVTSKEASCTMLCSDTYYAYRNDFEEMSNLNISNTGYEVPISFAVRRDDVNMYSFIKKGLASIQDTDIRQALLTEDYANPEMNVKQFLIKHILLVVIVLAIILSLILLLFIYYIISNRKNMRLLKSNTELTEKTYIDFATGIPNKNKCEEIISSNIVISKPTACFMLDLNDLKKVNDNLGHEVGDLMIFNFAKMLRKVVPLQYFVGRFGGDEFIVIAKDISGKDEAEKMLKDMKEMVIKFNGMQTEFQISYACGYAFSKDYPQISMEDLLNEADKKMYEDKIKSKKGRDDSI